jgi:acetyltransferase-like isoleucine patch superfamily enzyme
MAVLAEEERMIGRLGNFLRQPLSRQLQAIHFMAARLKTASWYRWRLRACGANSVVLRPLFWTPEFISLGKGVLIWPGARIEALEVAAKGQVQPHVEIGDAVTIQQHCHITCGGSLQIGAGTTILCNVVITDMDHEYHNIGRSAYEQPIRVRETRIDRNCFIGAGARLLPGTVLGEQCVVGANAVVRGQFPPYSVLGGNPARIVKQFDPVSATWRAPDAAGDELGS